MVWIGKRDAGYLRWVLTQFIPPEQYRALHTHLVNKLGIEVFAQQQHIAQQAKGITPTSTATGGIRPISPQPQRPVTPPSNPDQERERIKKLQEAMGK